MLGELYGEALSQADPHVRRWTPTQGETKEKASQQPSWEPDMESSHKAT